METNSKKIFICIVERPDGSTYEQQFDVISINKSIQLAHCQKLLGPKSGKYSYWACDGYYK